MGIAHCLNDTDRCKEKHLVKSLPQCHFVYHKSQMNWPESEPVPSDR